MRVPSTVSQRNVCHKYLDAPVCAGEEVDGGEDAGEEAADFEDGGAQVDGHHVLHRPGYINMYIHMVRESNCGAQVDDHHVLHRTSARARARACVRACARARVGPCRWPPCPLSTCSSAHTNTWTSVSLNQYKYVDEARPG
jgi:hypothetical protein